jgi:fimbrial chaperone protein
MRAPAPPLRLAATAALVGALSLPALRVLAADLEVSPVVVEFAAGRRTAILTLRNGGAAPARFQAKALTWSNGTDGAMRLAPTREVAVFPPLLELAPGESRNVRVGTDVPATPVERAWRLTVEELPREDAPPDGMRVRVLTRVGLPVFLAPEGRPVSRGEVVFLERANGKIRFTIRNTGTVRLRPTAVALALVTARGEVVFEKQLEPWYVLAHEDRIYEIQPPPGACERAAEMIVTVQLERGALTGRAPGACRGP